MTIFIWMDENGEWKATHLPPTDGSACIRVMCTEMPVFFGEDNQEIEVSIR